MGPEVLKKIREIRNLESPQLKSSPYLKTNYVDEWGVTQKIKLRTYQTTGIMNMLMVPRFLIGDDTGLGKTLEVLSTIGYVWLKEPEYIPIIITKKSALFQWEAETQKFMQGMEVITVEGKPFERDKIYKDFFLNHGAKKKRLIILTYETLFRDLEETIVRDRSKKPGKELNKSLKLARKQAREFKKAFEDRKTNFDAYFQDRNEETVDYLRFRLSAGNSNSYSAPTGWTKNDEDMTTSVISLRKKAYDSKETVDKLNDQSAPPKRIPGVKNYMLDLLRTDPNTKFMFVMDEVHVLKNHRGKMHAAAAIVAALSHRVIGMTATPVKNRLMEFFSLFRVIQPGLFPKISHFQNEFCVTRLQPIGGGRKVPIVVGYRNLDEFVRRIELFYLSRRKHEVAKELPQLITRELTCELTIEQQELYDLAEAGLLNQSDDPDASSAEVLSSMVMVQQAANAPQLIADENGNPFEGESSKINTVLDLLQDELDGVKTIIFSRFEKMISLIESELKQNEINCVRITGKENKAKDREKFKNLFQDVKSGIDVILITMAGAESINLQSAEHLIFVDSPWSYGDYIQLTGRMIRIGSTHKVVVASHLISFKRNQDKTIDHYVIKTLRGKKKLADQVSGEALKDGLKFIQSDDAMDIIQMIKGKDKETSLDKINRKIQMAKKKVAKKKTKKKVVKKTKPKRLENLSMIPNVDFSDI